MEATTNDGFDDWPWADAPDAPAPGVALSWPAPVPVGERLAQLLAAARHYEAAGKELLNRNPLESLLALVVGGAAVYYVAERGRSDKVNTYWDALEYVSTCASVGYSNIFPATPVGKLVASALFLVGPTLTGQALQPAKAATTSDSPHSVSHETAELAGKLDAILAELKRIAAVPSR